ncbi:MAG: glycosidase [Paraglaciecola sp.]|jgi:glycosidase
MSDTCNKLVLKIKGVMMQKIKLGWLLGTSLLIGSCALETQQTIPKIGTRSVQTTADIYQDYLHRDVRDDIFYFVMPDRFNNGDPQNDNGSVTLPISNGGLNLASKRGFHGGDIKGVEDKLDYLKNMGISAIWMTPILRNKAVQPDGVAHHGYWIVDFSQLDPHFGTNDDLKHLIELAHSKGIKVFFDIITNHTADVIKYEQCHQANGEFTPGLERCAYKSLAQLAKGDRYTPFIPEEEKEVKFPAWLNDPQYYHNQGDSTFTGESSLNGDFSGLDDLNTEHPKVLAGMTEIYKNLVKEFKPDGFRIDTVRHVRLPFWQAFSPAIMQYAKAQGIPNFHIFGEVYDTNPEALSRFTTEGKLPSVLDFGFQQAAADVFYRGQSPVSIQTLFAQDHLYNDEDSQADLLMTFLGNHDMGRSGYFINQGTPKANAEEKLQRSILSHAFMYFSRGIPVVYYGDEQGFTGDGNDVDAREDMFPSQVASYNDNVLLGSAQTTADDNFNPSHPIYQALAKLGKLRREHQILRRGRYQDRYFKKGSQIFAFARIGANSGAEYLMVFNAGTSEQTINVDANADSYQALVPAKRFSKTGDSLSITLPALSYGVYQGR